MGKKKRKSKKRVPTPQTGGSVEKRRARRFQGLSPAQVGIPQDGKLSEAIQTLAENVENRGAEHAESNLSDESQAGDDQLSDAVESDSSGADGDGEESGESEKLQRPRKRSVRRKLLRTPFSPKVTGPMSRQTVWQAYETAQRQCKNGWRGLGR